MAGMRNFVMGIRNACLRKTAPGLRGSAVRVASILVLAAGIGGGLALGSSAAQAAEQTVGMSAAPSVPARIGGCTTGARSCS